jgi:uncharacterized membrane protein YphA (DoxX/SURF4 family)
MRIAVPVYPGGRLGAGLLVLRLSMAGAALNVGRHTALGESSQWFLAIICVSLVLGVGTRWSTLAGAVALVVFGLPTLLARDLVIVGGLAAVALSGPGAWSIDARIWGRIRVRSRSSR